MARGIRTFEGHCRGVLFNDRVVLIDSADSLSHTRGARQHERDCGNVRRASGETTFLVGSFYGALHFGALKGCSG